MTRVRWDVAIAGGGLAGAALAIALTRRGLVVTLFERRRGPAHKVCGEFLSPDSGASLATLGVAEAVARAGAVTIARARVTARDGAAWCAPLPAPGLGLSRRALDELLLARAIALGVDLQRGCTVQAIEHDARGAHLVVVHASGRTERVHAALAVGAQGRSSGLDRSLGRGHRSGPGRVAFKLHGDGLDLGETVELHGFDGGYAGLSMVEGGRVNLCLQVDGAVLRAAGGSFAALRERVLGSNPELHARLARLRPRFDRPLAAAGFRAGPRDVVAGRTLLLGDAAGMIAPLAGDGMAMALASGLELAPLIAHHLDGRLDHPTLVATWRTAWRESFARRLRVGSLLELALSRPRLASVGLRLLDRAPALGRMAIAATRGALA